MLSRFFLPKYITNIRSDIFSLYEEKQIDDLRAIATLEMKSDNYNRLLKHYAITALGDLKAKEAIPDLFKILSTCGHKPIGVKQAAWALAKIGTIDAAFVLRIGIERVSFLLREISKFREHFKYKVFTFINLFFTQKVISKYFKKLATANGFSSKRALFTYLDANESKMPYYLYAYSSSLISVEIAPTAERIIPKKRKEPKLRMKYKDGNTFLCANCGEKISTILEKCPKCNEMFLCSICKLAIRETENIKKCPYCGSICHSDHFSLWLTTTKKCPKCLVKLELKDVITVILVKKKT